MPVLGDDPVVITRDSAVATIWLNRPTKRNAMSYDMWVALEHACTEVATDRTVRVVVLRGSGEHFCAGADIGHMRRSANFSKKQNHAAALAQNPEQWLPWNYRDTVARIDSS